MRDKHYKVYSYRLDNWVANRIKKLAADAKSYNQLFTDFLKYYDRNIDNDT